MGKRRSSLKEPRWHKRGKPEVKLHPMSIKVWITVEMMIWLAYDNCLLKMDSSSDKVSSYYIRIRDKEDSEITNAMFEKELKSKLQWEGQDYFEKASYEMSEGTARHEAAETFVKRRYPKWFNTNARNFIMEGT